MPTRTSILLGWLVLFGAALALFLLVALLAWWQRRRVEPRAKKSERAEWAAHLAAVQRRSAQATSRVSATQARAAEAEQERTRAWQELEEAQRAHDAARQAHQEASRRHANGAVDRSGQREVANAALAAYRRGDLSHDQLLRVWRWGSGWDPELEQREKALLQARAARREAHLRYQAAASAERTVSQQAAVAAAELRALAEEAEFAAVRSGEPA